MSRSYSPNEDVASSIDIREMVDDDSLSLPRMLVRAYGPQCTGCENHEMALMLACREEGQNFKDIFLNGGKAQKFISDIDTIRSNLSLKPLVFTVDTVLDAVTKRFLIDNTCLKTLFQDIDNAREEVSSYVETRGLDGPVDRPVRAKAYQPPTQEEHIRLRKINDRYYKPDPRDIGFSGIEPGFLLAALYNNANPELGAVMTPAEGSHIWDEVSRLNKPHEFDYINGRSIKCYFSDDYTMSFSRFGDYNTMPVTAVIALSRQGIYLRASDNFREQAAEKAQAVLGAASDANRIATAEEFTSVMEDLVRQTFSDQATSDMLEDQISMYRQNMIDGSKRSAIVPHQGIYQYQVSLMQGGEVGQYFKLFDEKARLRVVRHNTLET